MKYIRYKSPLNEVENHSIWLDGWDQTFLIAVIGLIVLGLLNWWGGS
jgi:hypothetical protein